MVPWYLNHPCLNEWMNEGLYKSHFCAHIGWTGSVVTLGDGEMTPVPSIHTGSEIQTPVVWGRARCLLVTEAPHNTESLQVSSEETFLFLEIWMQERATNTHHHDFASKQGPTLWWLPILFEKLSSSANPSNTGRCASVGLITGHRIRRWPNSKPALAQRPVFAG